MLNQLIQRVWGQSAPATYRTARSNTSLTGVSGNSVSERSGSPLRTATYVKAMPDSGSKYYEMRENEDATFDAYYGRVGGFRSKATHSIDQWERKIREKKARGYIDQTHSFADSNPATLFAGKDLTIESVTDKQVQKLIKRMMGAHADKFDSAFSVRHTAADMAFDTYVRQQPTRKTLALWHNSHSDNWLSSLHANLSVQVASEHSVDNTPANEIHFTEQVSFSSRSGFSPDNNRQHEGYLAIYEVHIDEQPEFIVHNPAQCSIRYIVKIKA